MRTTPFTIEKSGHGLDCVQASDLTADQCRQVRGIVCNIYMDSEDYRLRQPSGAFLQGYEEPRNDRQDGWVLVEFWSHDQLGKQSFVDHINKALGLTT